MDKRNLIKAILTLYVSAVAGVFFFHPTVKEFVPARMVNDKICTEARDNNEVIVLGQYYLIGNKRYKLKPLKDNCFKLSENHLDDLSAQGQILILRKGRTLWETLKKK